MEYSLTFPIFKVNEEYHGIFYGILSVPCNIVMDLNNVMSAKEEKQLNQNDNVIMLSSR